MNATYRMKAILSTHLELSVNSTESSNLSSSEYVTDSRQASQGELKVATHFLWSR